MMRIGWMLLLVSVLSQAWAGEAIPTEQDPVAQARAVELARKLRCLVCQNQTIADSEADLAQDLRRQIAEQIAAGRSDAEIVAFMTDRYGDFVLYQPPVKATTIALWFGPGALLLLAAVVLIRKLRQHARSRGTADLTEEERTRAQALLDGGGGTGTEQ